MIISHKHKFIFLKTRKVAGSSVELALSKICGPDDILTPLQEEEQRADGIGAQNYRLPFRQWPMSGKIRRLINARITPRRSGYYDHIPAEKIAGFLGEEKFQDYFKFTIERNPWDRQVSQYFWETKDLKSRPDFLSYMKKPTKHTRIPNWNIYTRGNKVCADYVLQYDRLSDDFRTLIEKIQPDRTDIELPRAKSGIRPKRDYRELYCDETRQMVSDWYAPEIEAFGYKF